MKHLLRLTLGIALLTLAATSPAAERVALIVGNGAYQNGSVLENPANDATLLAKTLREVGFEVALVTDASLEEMEKALVDFGRSARDAKAAWFFYAGHGVEVKGQNFLIPVDADVDEEFQVKHKTLALDMVLGALDEAETPLKVIVLDCCRDNPFARSWKRSGTRGLSQVTNPPTGTIIAFAAAPGSVAEDGTGANSPFSTALSEALTQPGREIDQVFKETGRLVIAATEKRQQPWVNSSFYDTFVVRGGAGGETTLAAPAAAPGTAPAMPASAPKPPVAAAPVENGPLKPFALTLARGLRAGADEIEIAPEVFSVGKWPEGLAKIGDQLWVAESGQRSLGKIDANTGKLIERVTCGRLPVNLATVGDLVYATINTDNQIWRQPATGKGGLFADVGEYPEGLAAIDRAVYAMIWPDGSSEDSAVVRLDTASSKTKRSKALGSNAEDIVVAGDQLWVLNNPYANDAFDARLSRLDPDSLEILEQLPIGGAQRLLEASGDQLFVGGGDEEYGALSSYDAASGEVIGYADFTGPMVVAMAVEGEMVVTADATGTIHLHHRDTLQLQRKIHLGLPDFSPRDLLATPEALYLTIHVSDEVGVIYKVSDWKPEGLVADPVSSRLLKAESIGGLACDAPEADMIRLFGEPEERGEELESEITGGFVMEALYLTKGMTIVLQSEKKGGPRTINSIHLDGKSDLTTAGGIHIGHSLEEVRLVYGEFEDKIEAPVPDPIEDEFTYVAGSLYEGLIFQFKGGKVSSLVLGAGAE